MTTTPSPWPFPEGQVRLNLGCQSDIMDGWLNVDRCAEGANVICDLTERWPFGDETADFILASHIVEHLPDLGHFLREAHRVLKPGCALVILTEDGGSPDFCRDPTHVRGYRYETFAVYMTIAPGDPHHLVGYPDWTSVEVETGTAEVENQPLIHTLNARLTK